jgi:broad specificity phosphatase PhoE
MAEASAPSPDPCSIVLLIRHAEAAVPDEKGRYVSEGPVPLSENGHQQARVLAKSLSGLRVDRLVCSDMLRAVQTAEYVGATLGLEADRLSAFREVNCGNFDGLSMEHLLDGHPEYVSWVEAGFQQRFATEERHFPASLRFPGGESVLDMAGRAVPAFLEVCTAPAGRVTVIISHAWAISVLVCHVLGLGPESYYRFGMPNTGVAVVRVGEHGRGMLDASSWQAPLERLAGSSLPVHSADAVGKG